MKFNTLNVMKKIILTTFSALLIVVSSSDFASAKSDKKSNVTTIVNNKKVTIIKDSKPKVVSKLPAKSVTMQFKGANIYKDGYKYYKKVDSKFVVIAPPIGLRVSIIPAIHTIFKFNNINYYCSEGVIYKATEDDQFEVVQPEVGMIVPELPEVNVREVNIDGTIYFEFEGLLYKQIPTESGLQYKVSGSLAI